MVLIYAYKCVPMDPPATSYEEAEERAHAWWAERGSEPPVSELEEAFAKHITELSRIGMVA